MPGMLACDTTSNMCVACLANSDCASTHGGADGGTPTPFCRTFGGGGGGGGFGNQCVECLPAMGDAGIQGCAAGQMCIGGTCR
jgi:hypothetical protein